MEITEEEFRKEMSTKDGNFKKDMEDTLELHLQELKEWEIQYSASIQEERIHHLASIERLITGFVRDVKPISTQTTVLLNILNSICYGVTTALLLHFFA